MTQGAVQAAGTGGPNSAAGISSTTGGPWVPATTSTSTFLVKAGQGEGGSSTTTAIRRS